MRESSQEKGRENNNPGKEKEQTRMWTQLENHSAWSNGELCSIKCTTAMVLPKGKETRVVFSYVNPALRGSGFNLLVEEAPTWFR